MSVVEKFSKLFSRRSEEPQVETSGELSLAMPDASIDPMMATGAMDGSPQQRQAAPAEPDSGADDSVAPPEESEQADFISVPLLGRSSAVDNQRELITYLQK